MSRTHFNHQDPPLNILKALDEAERIETGRRPVRGMHLAVYGNVKIARGECPECGDMALIVKGLTKCCDARVDGEPKRAVRISEPDQGKRRPPLKAQRAILEQQGHCCLYCERAFGSFVVGKRGLVPLIVNWDHLVPFAYGQDNSTANFVAACQLCNSHKGSRVFQTLDEAKTFLSQFLCKTEPLASESSARPISHPDAENASNRPVGSDRGIVGVGE